MNTVFEIISEADGTVLRPTTNLVAESMADLRAGLREAINDKEGEIRIDLAKVEFMDSSGIGLLIAAHNSLKERSAQLRVIGASDNIADLLTSMCLDRHFPIERADAS